MANENKKVKIVVELGDWLDPKHKKKGRHFFVYLESDGNLKRLDQLDEDKLNSCEFWGKKLFQICQNAIKMTGAFQYARPKDSH